MPNANGPKEGTTNNPAVTNQPGQVLNNPGDVQKSNDEKIDQDFPGYPHYPAKEDILNPGNDTERVDLDVEDLSRSGNPTAAVRGARNKVENGEDLSEIEEPIEMDIDMVPGTDADVTAEDLALLGPKEGDMDMDEDEDLQRRGYSPRSGRDLDVPGDADNADRPGEEDEENSYYSLGGDEKDNLEESREQGIY